VIWGQRKATFSAPTRGQDQENGDASPLDGPLGQPAADCGDSRYAEDGAGHLVSPRAQPHYREGRYRQ
jgi:hypothetical protein